MELIRQLYKIEELGRKRQALEEDFDADSIKDLRQEKSVPILEELREWMQSCLDVPPGNPLAKAISYTLDNWKKLLVYTTDGRLSIDNNAVERSMRAVINLWDYLNDVFTRLPSNPINRLEELLPNRWKELRAQPPPD